MIKQEHFFRTRAVIKGLREKVVEQDQQLKGMAAEAYQVVGALMHTFEGEENTRILDHYADLMHGKKEWSVDGSVLPVTGQDNEVPSAKALLQRVAELEEELENVRLARKAVDTPSVKELPETLVDLLTAMSAWMAKYEDIIRPQQAKELGEIVGHHAMVIHMEAKKGDQ